MYSGNYKIIIQSLKELEPAHLEINSINAVSRNPKLSLPADEPNTEENSSSFS